MVTAQIMQIYVRNEDYNKSNGYPARIQQVIDVEATDTLRSLKALIQRMFSISDKEMGRRMLVHGGRDLLDEGAVDPSSTLHECGIKEWASLEVGVNKAFVLRVSASDHCSYEITVSPLDRIHDVKGRIQETRLDDFDDMTLLSYGIFMKNSAANYTGISFARKNQQHQSGPPWDEWDAPSQIAVEIPNMPWQFNHMFNSTDTIASLSNCISKFYYRSYPELHGQSYIKEGRFLLFYGGKELPKGESTTMGDCGIKHTDSIQLFQDSSFSIFIHARPSIPRTCVVKVKSFFTVRILKARVHDTTGIPPERQRLVYDEWFLDDDKKRLGDYGITRRVKYDDVESHPRRVCARKRPFLNRHKKIFSIRLFPPINNSEAWSSDTTQSAHSSEFNLDRGLIPLLHLDGDHSSATVWQIAVEIPSMPWRFPLMCKPTDTIGTMREDIRQTCYNRYDELFGQRYIEKGLFVILFYGKLLQDDSTTLGECGIKHMDSIQLLENASLEIVIAVNALHIKDNDVKCFHTIGLLKEKIEVKTGIPPERQRMTYNLWFLDDGERLLVDYGISKPVVYDESISRITNRPNPPFQSHNKRRFLIRVDDTAIGSVSSSKIEAGPSLEGYRKCNLGRCHASFSNVDHSSPNMLQLVVEIPTMPLRFPLMFKRADTIGDVRHDIRNKVYYPKKNLFIPSFINKGLFVLVFEGKQLEVDSITLSECRIKNMDSIQVLENTSVEIVIYAPGLELEIPFDVACCDTIGILKGKLGVRTGIPPERLCLMYHEWFLDDDERRLVEYGIANESFICRNTENHNSRFVIFLSASADDSEPGRCSAPTAGLSLEEFRKYCLYAGLPHATFPDVDCSSATTVARLQIAVEIPIMPWRFPLVCKPTDTISIVREDIRQKCYKRYAELFGQTYIEKGQFVLVYDRKQLVDESITLANCGIKHMDSIQLLDETSFPIEITVDERQLNTSVDVRCFDTIRMLNEKLLWMTGIPPERQHLAWCEWWLDSDDEGRRFLDYGIAKEVTYDESIARRNPGNDPFWIRPEKNFCIHAATSRSLLKFYVKGSSDISQGHGAGSDQVEVDFISSAN